MPQAMSAVTSFGAIHDLHLADARHAVHGEQPVDLDGGAGLFQRFALRGLLGRLAQLHVAGGQGPEALARFDGALGQQDLVDPLSSRQVQTAPATTLGFW